MKFHRGIEISEIVGDFIKDELGNWWLIGIKAFKMIEKIEVVKPVPKTEKSIKSKGWIPNS